MPVNLERILARPEPEYISIEPGVEMLYPLPTTNAFKSVNAAVFYAFSRLSPTTRVDRDEVDGGVAYYFRFEHTLYQLFVLHITDSVASLRFHRCELREEALQRRGYVWQPRDPEGELQYGLAAILNYVHEAIVDTLRCAVKLDNTTIPPPPPASELYHVFTWQQIYYPDMTDKELADLIGVSHQTLRNARSRYKQGKRTSHKALGEARVPRGKQKR